MSHGENAARHNREYWSRRPYSGRGWGKQFKLLTHRAERRVQKKRILRAELGDALDDTYLSVDCPSLVEGM